MATPSNAYRQVNYALNQPLNVGAPVPIIANRAPTTLDRGYPLGTIWDFRTSNLIWILSSVIGNVATWLNITTSFGPGNFSTLSASGSVALAFAGASVNTIGNTTGDTSVSILVGTGGYSVDGVGASDFLMGPSTTTGNIGIGGTAQTGAIVLGSSSAGQSVEISNGTGAGATFIADNQTGGLVSVGAAMTVGTITLGAPTQTIVGSVTIASANVSVTAATATSGGTLTCVVNKQFGVATYTGQTTAAAATDTLVLSNTTVSPTSGILATITNQGSNDAELTIQRVNALNGSFTVLYKNNGAAALNGNIILTFWVAAP